MIPASPTDAPAKAKVREVPSRRSGTDWSIAGPLLAAHLFSFAAPFTFTPGGLGLFLIFYVISGLGVTAGAHRYFTHRSFQCGWLMDRLLGFMFLLSAQGSLLRWVRDHHIHHSFSDKPGDPHSPHSGGRFWHAQLTWLWEKPPDPEENKKLYEKYAVSLRDHSFARRFSDGRWLMGFHLLFIAVVYALGACWQEGISFPSLISGWFTGLSFVVWGIFLRIVCVLHATSLVNSAAHLRGYRNYETREESRNNVWVALVSLGEGWHNNHHGRPAASNQGFHRWWEFDFTFCFLCLLGGLRLIRGLKVYRPKLGETETWFVRKTKKQYKP